MQDTLSPKQITVYLIRAEVSFTAVLIYVDDILLIDNDLKKFVIKYVGIRSLMPIYNKDPVEIYTVDIS